MQILFLKEVFSSATLATRPNTNAEWLVPLVSAINVLS